MEFAQDVRCRTSKRGLVIALPSGDAMLLEHPRAAELPTIIRTAPTRQSLSEHLGAPDGVKLVAELVEAGIVVDESIPAPESRSIAASRTANEKRMVITRSGVEFTGIERPARWINAHIMPSLRSIPGRLVLAVLIIAGLVSLISGRPSSPAVSASPAVDALLGISLGLIAAAAHELGHAVSLVHYGRTPRRAGFGFYWGSICFYIDSTDAFTLPRRQRVTQALAGLAVDVVVVAVFASIAQLSSSIILVAVLWRLAVVGVVNIVTNALPLLQLDGHWALADWLDEPELAARARQAFGAVLRGRRPTSKALAGYGAASIIGGIALTIVGAVVWWAAIRELAVALFIGNIAEVLIGVYLVAPFVLGALFSTVGLLREVVAKSEENSR